MSRAGADGLTPSGPVVRGAVGSVVAVLLVLLGAPAAADAARVTSARPWAASNEYLVKENLDGRLRPQSEPRAKVDYLKRP